MIEVDVNYLAVLVSAIAAMVIGFAWYSQSMFGKQWLAMMGKSKTQIQKQSKGMGKLILVAFIASLLTAYVLAHFVAYLGANTVMGGMEAAFWIWLGFVATIMINSVLWEGRPVKFYLINAAHQLATLVVMGIILAVWS